jgi:hypothetical protein
VRPQFCHGKPCIRGLLPFAIRVMKTSDAPKIPGMMRIFCYSHISRTTLHLWPTVYAMQFYHLKRSTLKAMHTNPRRYA